MILKLDNYELTLLDTINKDLVQNLSIIEPSELLTILIVEKKLELMRFSSNSLKLELINNIIQKLKGGD